MRSTQRGVRRCIHQSPGTNTKRDRQAINEANKHQNLIRLAERRSCWQSVTGQEVVGPHDIATDVDVGSEPTNAVVQHLVNAMSADLAGICVQCATTAVVFVKLGGRQLLYAPKPREWVCKEILLDAAWHWASQGTTFLGGTLNTTRGQPLQAVFTGYTTQEGGGLVPSALFFLEGIALKIFVVCLSRERGVYEATGMLNGNQGQRHLCSVTLSCLCARVAGLIKLCRPFLVY
eukprot:1093540-Amphidinium_carterae.2